MAALKENNEFAVQGTVRVLKEFVRDLSDSQISNVAPVILPDMYRIFMEKEVYTVSDLFNFLLLIWQNSVEIQSKFRRNAVKM